MPKFTPRFKAVRAERETEKIHFPGLLKSPPITEGIVGTFPNVGVMRELVEGFAQHVGNAGQIRCPPPVTAKTLDYGARYGAEGSCLPFKLLAGNLFESLESGAEMVGMITERGPCRLGLYSLGMRVLFADMGIEPAWFDLNNADLKKGYLDRFRGVFRKVHGRDVSLFPVLKALVIGMCRLMAVEKLEKERNRLLAYETRRGSLSEIFEEALVEIRKCNHPPTISYAMHKARRQMRHVGLDMKRKTVNVVVTGEAYCVLEGFANGRIELQLAQLGVVPHRVLWQTNYLLSPLRLDWFSPYCRRRAVRAARGYLPEQIGGDCNANVGHALLAHHNGADGLLHLKPFGCMLEFVAENLLHVVSRDTGFPILSMTLDDMIAEERVNVRLEAFVDGLFARANQNKSKSTKRRSMSCASAS